MTALPAYFSNTSDTYTNTTTTYAWTGDETSPVIIPGSFLTAGNKVLIGYTACYGSSTTSAVGELFVGTNRNDTFAHSKGEGFDTPATPYEPMRTQALCGWYLLTADGTDCEIAHRCLSSSTQIDIHGASLLGVDISTLTEGVDYFQSQLNQSTGSEVPVATWTTGAVLDVHTANFTLPSDGDFLVLASMEGSSVASGPLDGTLMQLDINGTVAKDLMQKEAEDAQDIHSFSYAHIHTFTAGANTLKLQGGSMKGTGDKEYWRPRIFMFSVASFDQLVQNSVAGTSVHNMQIPNYQQVLAKTYTPNQSEDVVIITNGLTRRGSQGSSAHAIYNTTTASIISPYVANAIQATDGTEQAMLTNLAMETRSAATSYALWTTGSDAATIYTEAYSLIMWGMTLAGTPPGGEIFLSHEDTSLTMTDTVSRTIPVNVTESALTLGTEDITLALGLAYVTHEDAALTISDNTALVVAPPAGILPHPRLVPAARLAQLRDLAGADGTGTGPGTAYWQDLKDYITVRAADAEPEHFAWAYAATGNIAYAQSAWAKLQSDINGGPALIAGYNNKWLYNRDFMRGAAYVFDLCYDSGVLDQTAKDRIVNYMNAMVFISWMRTTDANDLWDTESWADRNPNQNYFSGYMLGTMYNHLATEGENDGTFVDEWGQGNNTPGRAYTMTLYFDGLNASSGTYTNLWDYWNAKLTMAWSEWDVRCEGGGWNEGANYGRAALRHQTEMFLLMKECNKHDYLLDANHPHLRQTVNWWLHFAQPGTTMLYHDGDAAATPDLYVNPYDRHLMLMLGRGLVGTPESEYARWWCQNGSHQQMSGIGDMRPYDFWEDDPTLPATDYRNTVPTQAHFPGVDFWTSRFSWDDTAVCVSMRSTDPIVGHNHLDQNGIQIFRGPGAESPDGWQVCDRGAFSSSVPNSTAEHNCINVNNYEQRKEPFWPLGSPKTGYDVAGDVTRYEFGTDYSYGRGDASDAYWQGKIQSTSHGTDKMTNICHRELFHVAEGYVFVYDRVRLVSTIYNPVDAYWHFPHLKPTDLGGGSWRSTNDVGRAYQHVLLPESYNMEWLDEDASSPDRDDTWRMKITATPSTGTTYSFLSVFEVTASTNNSPATVVQVTSAGGEMTGCQIKDATEHKIILVSTSVTGASPSAAFSYTIDLDGSTHKHYLANLTPGDWGVTFVDNGTTGTITADPAGTGTTVSSQGVLVVTTFAAGPDVVLAFTDTALTILESDIHLNPHRKYVEPALVLGPVETTLQVSTVGGSKTVTFEELPLSVTDAGIILDVPNHHIFTDTALVMGPSEASLQVETSFDYEARTLLLSEVVTLDVPNHHFATDTALRLGPSTATLIVESATDVFTLVFEDRVLTFSESGKSVSVLLHARKSLDLSGSFNTGITVDGTMNTGVS